MQQKRCLYLKGNGKTLRRPKPLLVNLPRDKNEDRRRVGQRPLPDPKSYRRTKTKAAQDFAVERSYDHQIKQGGGLLPFRQAAEVARQHALLQVPKVVRAALGGTVHQGRRRPGEVGGAALGVLTS